MTMQSIASTSYAFCDPDDAVAALCQDVEVVGTEQTALHDAVGRVLAEPICLACPSPACDVSAMDGYAVRSSDTGQVAVCGEVQAGSPAPAMPKSGVLRVFTGAMVPAEAEAVLPREQVKEDGDSIVIPAELRVRRGQHIRRSGENGNAGDRACSAGNIVTAPVLAAAASCGMEEICAHRKVRVGVLVTGDEVRGVGSPLEPWQLRDSNGPALLGLLGGYSWLSCIAVQRVSDEPEAIRAAAVKLLKECDALLLTGGVSAGDYDYVPSVLQSIGFRTIFHKLPIRPGKPVLAAVDAAGKIAIGLPGNPVSAMVTARRFALPALRQIAGVLDLQDDFECVDIVEKAKPPAGLTWFPLVRTMADGRVEFVNGRGSGDWVSAAKSVGFLQVPAGEGAAGRRRLYRWRAPM